MFALAAIMAGCVAIPIGVGVLAYRSGRTLPAGGPGAYGRAAAIRVGSARAAVAILLLGTLATTALSLLVGFLAKVLEDRVDVPALDFVSARVHPSHLSTLNAKLTVIGNNGNVQVVCLLAGIILAANWRRHFWVPVVLIGSAFYLERYSQRFLAHTVDRGHPPTSLGTYPSGGVGRLLSVYGLILVLIVCLLPALSRQWRVGLYTGLGTFAALEAFTRVYLSKHWLTDAVGGLIFGYLGLAVLTAAAAALTASYRPDGGGPVAPLADRDATQARGTSGRRRSDRVAP